MKVLLLFWGSGEGGDATVAIELARLMLEEGDEFDFVACAYRHPTIFQRKCEEASISVRLVSGPDTLWGETRLRREDFHVIHVVTGRAIPKWPDIPPLRRLAGKLPIVMSCHGPEPLWAIDYGSLTASIARYFTPRWFHFVAVPSDTKLNEWRENVWFTKNLVKLPCPVRLLNRRERNEARERWEVPPDAKVVLFCGAIADARDPEAFVRAIALLRSKRPELLGLMAGIGELEEPIQALVKELGVPIRFLGYVEDLASLFSAVDAYVQPSLYESFGITLYQAAAVGLPCAITRIPVFEEFYAGQRGIRWIEPGDVEGCAQAIEACLGEVTPEDCEHLKAHMLRQYSGHQVLAMHRELWRRAVIET